MGSNSPQTTFGVANIVIPPKGPKTVPMELDFSVETSFDISGELITSQGHIEYIQGVYIDNDGNDDPVTLTIGTTNQRITAAPNSQGYYPALFVNPPTVTVTTVAAASKRVRLQFYNVPIQSQNWSTNDDVATGGLTDAELRASPVPVSGPLTDTQLRASPVEVESPATLADFSQAMTGADQLIVNAGLASRYLFIYNAAGNNPITVNIAGTAIGASGFVIDAGGSFTHERGITNAVRIQGTNTEFVVVYAG